MLTAIRQWVIKTMMKGQTGVVQTLPKKEIIEMNVQITAQRLMQNGINPNDLKTVGQVENVVNQIEQPKVKVNPGMTSVKKADVLDMEGNKIPEGSKIMGGKAVSGTSSREKIDWLVKNVDPNAEQTIPPKFVLQEMLKDGREDLIDHFFEIHTKNIGSKPVIDIDTSGLKHPELVKKMMTDRKLKPTLVNQESDAAIKARIEAGNEKGIASMKKKLEDPEEKADGGRIGLLAGSTKIPAVISALLKNKKKVDQAVDNIFPTGDYKLDAEMVAESIVELNPKPFNNMLYDDLDDVTRSEIYGAALSEVSKKNALILQMKKATKPEKTLQSMKEGKGINMSDPDIAEEFARFMKETDPKGTKDIEEKILLESFDPKRTKGNADGGRIGLEGGTNEDFQKYLKERERFEKERGLEQLFREYQEDLRRQEVGEQKQMAADGGRIGLKAGMTKRNFLKLMGSVGAGIGAVKSGIFSGLGKGATKQAAKEVVQQTTSSTPPPYFFKLAEKIKMMGDDVTATTDRTIAKKLPSKDGKSEYLLEEDMVTGDTSIKKIYKEDDNMITDVEIMELRKGEVVQTKDGKAIKTPDEYEEVTEVNKRIYKDDYNASDYTDGINVDEIIKEVDDQAPPIKYASGGLAYMLGE